MNFGAPELMIILLVVLVLFGGARLPQLARSLGQAQAEFRKGIRDDSTARTDGAAGDEKITMTRSELEALVAEREEAARRTHPPG
jgi:sec-independent protein translocase protein TatA